MEFNINETETFDEYAEIVSIYGQGCNYETKKGVEGFQVDFDITVTNNEGSEKSFHIVYQNSERFDNIRAYNGIEMETADSFGCDSDESSDLMSWLEDGEDYDTYNEIDEALTKEAEALCKEWRDENFPR